uniref:NB-ARC domain-containing protein n=1 Tax=Clytia hemisphaerica TaxID=252671 RepID=A0A7M5XEQ4_9CNID
MLRTMSHTDDDQERGFRCQVLLGKLDHQLRERIYKKLNTRDPAKLFQFFQSHKATIDKLRKKNVIKDEQYKLLLPSSGMVYFDQFDSTLLFFVTREFFGENMKDLIKIRNRIQHGGTKVSLPEFNAILSEAEPPLLQLGLSKAEFDDICNIRIVDSKVKELMTKTSFNYACLPPVANHFRRANLVSNIHQAVYRQHHDDFKFSVVISGIGGSGKSETAREYWQSYRNVYYEDIVCWINCNNFVNIEKSFTEIANRCGINQIYNQNGSVKSLKELSNLVYDYISVRQDVNKPRKVLFVLDNVINQVALVDLIPETKKEAPHFLITSQCSEWDQRFDVIKIGKFSNEEAEQFLETNIHDVEARKDKEANQKLLKSLSYLPLALQQAFSFINENGLTVGMYLTIFDKRQKELLSEGTQEIGNPSVYTTLSLTYNRLLQEGGQEVIDLLNKISYLDGKDIRKGLLIKLVDDVFVLNKILSLLAKYSIIETTNTGTGFLENQINCHELTQTFIKAYVPNVKEPVYQELANTFIEDMRNCRSQRQKMDGKYWYQHFLFICEKDVENIFLMKFIDVQNDSIHLFETQGDMRRLCDCLKKIMEKLSHTDGYERKDLYLKTKHNYANTLNNLSHYHDALRIFKEIETVRKETLGERHNDYLTTKHEIGCCLMNLSHYHDALSIFKEIETVRKDTLGERHNNYLSTKHNIGHCLMNLSHYHEALRIFKEIETVQKDTLGERHNSYLTTKHNIGHCLMNLSRYNDALSIFKEIETVRKDTLGERHNNYLSTKHNIGQCLMKLTCYHDALSIFKEIEAVEKGTLGERHNSYLTTKHNIGHCLMKLTCYHDALRIFKEIEAVEKGTLGERHNSYLTTKHNIGHCLMKLTCYHDALRIFKEIEAVEKGTLGERHNSYLATKHSIGQCLMNLSHYHDALRIFKEIETVRKDTLGERHNDYLTTKHNIGHCLMNLSHYEDALRTFKEIEIIENKTVGQRHKKTLKSPAAKLT